MNSRSNFYEPTAEEIYQQTQYFTKWFTETYTEPDMVVVQRDKVFVARRGESVHIFGRTGPQEWEHLDEYHFQSVSEAKEWCDGAKLGSRDFLSLVNQE
jgi:uncharacterized protein YcaQ